MDELRASNGEALWSAETAGAPLSMPPARLAARIKALDGGGGDDDVSPESLALISRAAHVALRRAPVTQLRHWCNHLTCALWDSAPAAGGGGGAAVDPARRLAKEVGWGIGRSLDRWFGR